MSSTKAVSIRMRPGKLGRSARHTANPSMPGIIMSNTTRSGGRRSTAARSRSAICRLLDGEAVLLEELPDHRRDLGVVVDQEDVGHGAA